MRKSAAVTQIGAGHAVASTGKGGACKVCSARAGNRRVSLHCHIWHEKRFGMVSPAPFVEDRKGGGPRARAYLAQFGGAGRGGPAQSFNRPARLAGKQAAAWNGGNARPTLDRALPARAGAALSAAFRTKAGIGATKERHRFGAPWATPAPAPQVLQYRNGAAFAGAQVSAGPCFKFD